MKLTIIKPDEILKAKNNERKHCSKCFKLAPFALSHLKARIAQENVNFTTLN